MAQNSGEMPCNLMIIQNNNNQIIKMPLENMANG